MESVSAARTRNKPRKAAIVGPVNGKSVRKLKWPSSESADREYAGLCPTALEMDFDLWPTLSCPQLVINYPSRLSKIASTAISVISCSGEG